MKPHTTVVITERRFGSAYRWRCTCGKQGQWQERVRSARNGGMSHVIAAQRGAKP